MSYHSPRRQPLSLVHNRSNSTAGSSNGINNNNSASPGSSSSSSNSTFKRKLPSISALSSIHNTSPKASLETSREGRASLSFSPFTSPTSSSVTSRSASETAATTSGKLRARATTFSSSGLSTSISPYASTSSHASTSASTSIRSPQQLPPSSLGPARRTRSKTLSKSVTRAPPFSNNNNNITHTRKALSQDHRSISCTFVENDNLQRTLDLLEKHVEEQGHRLSLSSSASAPGNASNAVSPTTATTMLSAPLMQRTPSTPVQCNQYEHHGPTHAPSLSWSSNGSSQQHVTAQLSPPRLVPPYIVPDLELVFPSTSPSTASALSSSTSSSNDVGQLSSSTSSGQAVLSPQVERLSNLINDLSLFLPRADSLTTDQLQAIQNAVDSILGKTSQSSASAAVASSAQEYLGNAIQLKHDNINNIFADDMPTFYVGEPPSLHEAPSYTSSANSSYTNPLQASQTLYDPSTPQDLSNTDTEMLGASTKSTSSSIASLERNIGGIELQVQHLQNNTPLHEGGMNYYSFDNDPDLVPPRW